MTAIQTFTKVLFLPDIHVPHHDRQVLRVVREFQRDFKPQQTIIMGDMIDAESVSIHAKGRVQYSQLEEYDLARELLDWIKPTVILEGNHEERFQRPGNVPWELWEMLQPQTWFEVKKRGAIWVPYSNRQSDLYQVGKLTVIHGFSTNIHASKAEAESFGCVIHGHTHRIQQYQPKHAYYSHTGFNIGCLCQLDLAYQRTGRPRGWAQGFAFGYFFQSGHFSLYTVRLIGNDFVINNKMYQRKGL